ncbi:hypothetical protein ES708_19821 [subsurface metagenome]
MDKEYYYDEDGVRRRKRGITELQDINVDEISFVSEPASRKTFAVIKNLEGLKGDDKMNGEMVELKTWEDISAKELSTIREAVTILDKCDLTNDLKRAKETLTKYFGEREVKKYSDKCEWSTVQRQLYNGYCEDDLSFINENVEVEKSEDTKWPSLSGQFELNRKRLEKAYEEYAVEERAI